MLVQGATENGPLEGTIWLVLLSYCMRLCLLPLGFTAQHHVGSDLMRHKEE